MPSSIHLTQVFTERLAHSLGRLNTLLKEQQEAQRQSQLKAVRKEEARQQVWQFLRQCKPSTAPLCAMEPALHWRTRQLTEYEPRSFLMTRAQMLSSPLLRQMYEPLSSGHAIVRQMQLDIDGFSPQPTDFQRQVIDFTTQLSAPRIYGREWKTNQLSIKRINGWTETYHGIGALMTGRKEGKSTGLAMVTVISLFNIPSGKIALFSKTQQQARIILGMAKELAQAHARNGEFRIDTNKDEILVTHIATKNRRICTAYSGSADVSLLFYLVCFCLFGGGHCYLVVHGSIMPYGCGK